MQKKKNARRKLETHMASAMSCKRKHGSTGSRVITALHITNANASEKIPKIHLNCTVEAHESTRPRMESITKKNHEDHIAGKGQNSISHKKFWCTNSSQCRKR